MPPLLPLSMLYPSYLLHVYPQYQRWYADAKAPPPPPPPAASYSELARRYEAARLWESLARREMTSPANNGERITADCSILTQRLFVAVLTISYDDNTCKSCII